MPGFEGPATVAEFVAMTKESQSKVSNHLALLRGAGLVVAERRLRYAVYRLTNPAVAQLLESLAAVAGPRAGSERPTPTLVVARTCYDHLAGKLGVTVFDAFVASKTLTPVDLAGGDVGLGPEGPRTFARLGIDTETIVGSRRRFAYACLDWTEQRFHLGGALGAALCRSFLQRGWVVRRPGTRAVRLTQAGELRLRSSNELS